MKIKVSTRALILGLLSMAGGFLHTAALGADAKAAAAKSSYTFTKANNKVTFAAEAIGGLMQINGEGGAAEGKLDVAGGKVSGTLTVQIAPFKTGIKIRDEHMHEKYLESPKFPTATLTLKDQPFQAGDKEFSWTGDLTLKGKSHPVSGKATLDGKELQANFKLSIKNYPLGVPSYKDLTVADTVEVKIEGTIE